jgi:tryptophan halogenase
MEYGWSWNINLRHRSGNGYIYDPDHITLDRAVQEAEKFYGYKIDPIANFSFTPGIMKNAWKNNVIGIGLSSGFLEPLEANGVQVIIDSLHAVDDLWRPTKLAEQKERQNAFNQRVLNNTNDIRDFLSLHYRGHRRDTDFWKSHAYDKFRISDSLNIKLLQWEEYYNGYRNAMVRCNGYSPTAWLMVIQALGLFNTDNLKSSRYQFLEDAKNTLNNSYKKRKEYVESFWTIDQWLKAA